MQTIFFSKERIGGKILIKKIFFEYNSGEKAIKFYNSLFIFPITQFI